MCGGGREMSGPLTVLSVLGVTASLGMASVAVGVGAVAGQRASAAADAAALAAADASSGAVSGIPCDRAAEAAARNGATLLACSVDAWDGVATVTVGASALGLPIRASARAGPPWDGGAGDEPP